MTHFRTWIYICVVVALLTNLAASASAQEAPFACITSAGVTPIARAEGLSEMVGDLLLSCTGGIPTAPGNPVPQFNITVFLNTNITSKVLSTQLTTFGDGQSAALNEALLIIDEPNSPSSPGVQCGANGQYNGSSGSNLCYGTIPGAPPNFSTNGNPYPVLNCGVVAGNAPAAPDGGPSGPGVCSIIAPSGPGGIPAPEHTYDGTVAGGSYWSPPAGQSAYRDACVSGAGIGTVGAPGYACGRPNVFQGRVGIPQTPNQYNAVTFVGIPLDPPGHQIVRTIRITNIRADVNALGVPSTFLTQQVVAYIAINGLAVGISNPQQIVAYVNPGLNPNPCVSPAGSTVRVCEGFASSWKTKNISFTVGDNNGVPGNATFSSGNYVRNGNVDYPADDAQNVTGAVYFTESGFQWQNNVTNGPPSPNPPLGFGPAVPSNANNPLSDDWALTGNATGIAGAGVANSGTRFALQFSNLPPGASVQVPNEINLLRQGVAPGGTASGIMLLLNTDAAGAGPYSLASTGTLGPNNMAVYEVLYADPYSTEYADVPYTVTTGSTAGVQVTTTFAPFYVSAASTQPSPNGTFPSPTLPVARFAPGVNNCGSCTTLNPTQGVNTGPVTVQITGLIATSFSVTPGSVLALTAAGLPDIPGTVATPGLTWTFDLTGATPGVRDLSLNGYAADPGAFTVLGTPQTITFAALPNLPLGASPFTVSATASSTLAVNFSSQTTSVCTVSSTTVTLVANTVGTCTIQATQAGNTTYAAATPVNQSFQVTSVPQLVITKSLSRIGGVVSVTVTVTNTGGSPANNVQLTVAKIGSTGTTTALPLTVGTGTIAGGGGSAQAVVSFPGAVGTAGTATSLTLGGTYTGGSFASTARISLP
jgi:hypothetical protein